MNRVRDNCLVLLLSSMIRVLIFDAGGVLYGGDKEIVGVAVKRFLERHGVHDFTRSDRVWSEVEKLASDGRICLREAHERWLEGVGLSKDLVDEWAEVDKEEVWARFRRTPGINELLRKLKGDYILAVLSDTVDSKQEKVEKMGIVGVDHRVFDEIFTSHDLGACKPSRKAFQAVLKRFGVSPSEALFVGDACDELVGARKIGLTTIGFKCGCGDYNVNRLNEIGRILSRIKSNERLFTHLGP
jgi:HAD superfamily hydrolase (TIGR01549 family)